MIRTIIQMRLGYPSLTLLLGAWAILAQGANTVYIGGSLGLLKSTDAGGTWTGVNIPLNNPLLSGTIYVNALSRDPNNPSKLYFIGRATGAAFFASADGGQSWSATPMVGMLPYHLGVDSAGKVIYITATSGQSPANTLLFTSTDGGATWNRQKVPNTSTTSASQYPLGSEVVLFVADPIVSGTVYVLTNGDEFFKSVDFGSTWKQISGPGVTLTSGGVAPQTGILGIHVDPRNPSIWYDATDHSSFPATCPLTNGGLCGLFKSTDGGATFIGLAIPSNYVSSVSIGATPGTVYATGDVTGLGGTVLKTTDGGSTWTTLKNGLFTSRSGRVWADPTDASTLYVSAINSARDFYVSTDAGGHFVDSTIPLGPPGCIPGACTTQNVNDVLIVPSAAALPPVISANGVVNGASFQPSIVPNSWVTILGSSLASKTDDWTNFIVNGQFPTSVDGVSVMIGGKAAYIDFISPGQINLLAPDVGFGPLPLTVTTLSGTSATYTVTSNQYGPAFFEWPNGQPVATRQDFSWAVKNGTFSGTTTTPAKPGDVIILWGTGFGPTNPIAPFGAPVPSDKMYSTTTLPDITINKIPATVYGAALAPGFAGLYQIAIQVPPSIIDGDWPIQASIGGAQSPTGTTLSVHQ